MSSHLIVVGKVTGDVLFQHSWEDPTITSINAFAEELVGVLENYLISKKSSLATRDKDFFLEDIEYFFKNGEQLPYLYWITDEIFILVTCQEINNYEEFKKRVPAKPKVVSKDDFGFIISASTEDDDNNEDIGKIQTKAKKPEKKLPIGFITSRDWKEWD